MMHERCEVRPRRISCEAGERRGAIRRGVGGAKGRGRGNASQHSNGPRHRKRATCHRGGSAYASGKPKGQWRSSPRSAPHQHRSPEQAFLESKEDRPGVDADMAETMRKGPGHNLEGLHARVHQRRVPGTAWPAG